MLTILATPTMAIFRDKIEMNMRHSSPILLSVWLIGFPFANLGLAQIDQNRPDLCGKPAEYVPLPPGTVGAVSSPVGASLTITLTDGSTKTIDLDVADSITQVCPISKNVVD